MGIVPYIASLAESSHPLQPPLPKGNRPPRRPPCVKGAVTAGDWGIVHPIEIPYGISSIILLRAELHCPQDNFTIENNFTWFQTKLHNKKRYQMVSLFHGASDPARTDDLRITNALHYRLCYTSIFCLLGKYITKFFISQLKNFS